MKESGTQTTTAAAPAPQVAPVVAPVTVVQHAIAPAHQSVELSGSGAVDDTPSRHQQSSELIQFKDGAGSAVHATAAQGIAGPAQSLPHLGAIQQSFGEHDVSGVQAHVGGEADAANAAMGSAGFATGNHVAFKGSPDLHTAAHEAAHVVQQRQGVALKGGVGAAGDAYERHADAVADQVVQGKSAESLLSSGPSGGAAHDGVQHAVQFDGPDAGAPAGGAPAAPAAPSLVEQIRQALENSEEQNAITLMGGCTAAQANVVLNSYMSLGTSCFGNDTMGAACRALVRAGGDLGKALEWSIDEGTDYTTITSIINACQDTAARQALGTDAWRDRFVSELGNSEMAGIVDWLGLPLETKIRWMDAEGTGWDLLQPKIEAAPPEQRAPLRAAGWLPYFVGKCDNVEMAALVDLLAGDLVWKLEWMNAEGTDWAAMRIKIEAAPPEQRLAVYDKAELRAMFVSECNNEEMIAAVGLLGGPLSKRIVWCGAEGADTWAEVLGVINSVPEAERVSIYGSPEVVALFANYTPAQVLEAIRLCGGTPQQKLELWGARPITEMLPLISPTDDWAAGLLATGHADDLLRLAAGPQGAAWKTAVDNQNGGAGAIDAVIANCSPTSSEETYRGLYTLFGDATTRTRPQMDAVFPKLFAQTRLVRGGQMVAVVYPSSIPRHTDAAGRTYDVGYRPVPVDPSDSGMAAFFNIMQRVSRAAASTTNTLQFAAQEEFLWKQLTPVASVGYHPWTTPVFRRIGTSYAGGGVVTLQVHGAGATEMGQVVAANGAVTDSGVVTARNAGDVTERRAPSDRTGIASSVGGGEDRTATGGANNRTAAITYFQNHAIHEFGHSTGAAKYTNVPSTGNEFATQYGGWVGGKSAADFKAAYWTLSNAAAATPDVLTHPTNPAATYPVTADAVAAWLTSIVSTGTEPTGNAVTLAAPTLSVPQKLAMIGALPRFAGEKMFKYVQAVLSSTSVRGAPDRAYQFTGYTPVGDVWIWASRNGDSFSKYDNEAYTNCVPTLGWYSVSSPVEMFAEAFTSKYAGGRVPPSRGTGKDFEAFFTQLQNSPSIETAAGTTPGLVAGTPAGPAATETEPSSTIVPA